MTSFDVMGLPGQSVGVPRRRKVAISALAQGLVQCNKQASCVKNDSS